MMTTAAAGRVGSRDCTTRTRTARGRSGSGSRWSGGRVGSRLKRRRCSGEGSSRRCMRRKGTGRKFGLIVVTQR